MRVLPFLLVVFLLTSVLAVPDPSSDIGDRQGRPSSLSSDWRVETVETVGDVRFTSIALDRFGYPHISYSDVWNQSCKYAKWTGTQWSIETVDSNDFGCLFTSVALDNAGHPHISYHTSGDFDLKYAKWTGSAWSIETVDSEGSVGYYTSIALDHNDNPHISYYSSTNTELRHAVWTGSEWYVESVDSEGYVGMYNSLDLDSNDKPHISYLDLGNHTLKYAKRTGAVWEIDVIEYAYFYGYYPHTSVAIDRNDNPHISYYDQTDEDLKYARWIGSMWIIETVDIGEAPVGRAGAYSSLALDSNDYPHISYLDRAGGHLKYAHWTGRAWNIDKVDSDGFVGWWTSMALDGVGNPHISYSDLGDMGFRNGALKYATKADLQPPSRLLTLDIDPDTLNLKSRGRWIAAYLSAENASVHDINVSSILLQDTLMPERYDYQRDILMLKFNRQELQSLLQVGDSIEIKIGGKWEDRTDFEAYDYIRVINPGKK